MTRPSRAEVADIRSRLCSDDMDLVALCDAYLALLTELGELQQDVKFFKSQGDVVKELKKLRQSLGLEPTKGTP